MINHKIFLMYAWVWFGIPDQNPFP